MNAPHHYSLQLAHLAAAIPPVPVLLLLLELPLLHPVLQFVNLGLKAMLTICDIGFYNRGPGPAAAARAMAKPLIQLLAPVAMEVGSKAAAAAGGGGGEGSSTAAAGAGGTGGGRGRGGGFGVGGKEVPWMKWDRGQKGVAREDVMDVLGRLLMKMMSAGEGGEVGGGEGGGVGSPNSDWLILFSIFSVYHHNLSYDLYLPGAFIPCPLHHLYSHGLPPPPPVPWQLPTSHGFRSKYLVFV